MDPIPKMSSKVVNYGGEYLESVMEFTILKKYIKYTYIHEKEKYIICNWKKDQKCNLKL